MKKECNFFFITAMLTCCISINASVTKISPKCSNCKAYIGPRGPKGETGESGLTGQQGPRGLTGQKGNTGDSGATGMRGSTGDKGETGQVGAQGPIGPVGPTGQKGDQGIQGATGDAGAIGATGPVGPTGEQGPEGPSLTSSNYVFAYDTTTQDVATASTFQDVTFNTNAQLNGWSHVSGSSEFICNQTGLYYICYSIEIDNRSLVSLGSTTSALVTVNTNQASGSQASVTLGALTGQIFPLSNSFILQLNANDSLKVRFTGSSTLNQIVANNGSGSVRPSAVLTIIRLG